MGWNVSEVILPFNCVATHDRQRVPGVMLKPDVQQWIWDHEGKVSWHMGSWQDPEVWKVRLEFPKEADALLFKLTFGGA